MSCCICQQLVAMMTLPCSLCSAMPAAGPAYQCSSFASRTWPGTATRTDKLHNISTRSKNLQIARTCGSAHLIKPLMQTGLADGSLLGVCSARCIQG